MSAIKAVKAARSAFHHGDLRQALLEAGFSLARNAGPSAVLLREATRQAGVAPNAAYRHFASQQELLQAVRNACLAALAKAIEAELASLKPVINPKLLAKASLRAVGTGYLNFAQDEPGLFRTGFSVPNVLSERLPEKGGDTGLDPFELLGNTLDQFVESGLMSRARRQDAEFLAWSAVHGLALLIIDGPLHKAPRQYTQEMGERLLVMVEQGLCQGS
jgi:AcrR family transcriptional regulator